jgi:hypothetical protein
MIRFDRTMTCLAGNAGRGRRDCNHQGAVATRRGPNARAPEPAPQTTVNSAATSLQPATRVATAASLPRLHASVFRESGFRLNERTVRSRDSRRPDLWHHRAMDGPAFSISVPCLAFPFHVLLSRSMSCFPVPCLAFPFHVLLFGTSPLTLGLIDARRGIGAFHNIDGDACRLRPGTEGKSGFARAGGAAGRSGSARPDRTARAARTGRAARRARLAKPGHTNRPVKLSTLRRLHRRVWRHGNSGDGLLRPETKPRAISRAAPSPVQHRGDECELPRRCRLRSAPALIVIGLGGAWRCLCAREPWRNFLISPVFSSA